VKDFCKIGPHELFVWAGFIQIESLLTSASGVARIIGMLHWCLAEVTLIVSANFFLYFKYLVFSYLQVLKFIQAGFISVKCLHEESSSTAELLINSPKYLSKT
jgi:hypothetical protein